MDEEIKTDEEQIVEDTDADTKDVIEAEDKQDDKLDTIESKLDELIVSMADMFDNLASVIIKSGAAVVINDDPAEDVEEAYEALEDMDFTLDEIED